MGGPQGDTTLCLEVPEDLFREREAQESTRPLTADEEKQIESGWPEPAVVTSSPFLHIFGQSG